MRITVIENTKIKVSCIGYGTGSLHRLFSSRDRQNLLSAALSVGITHFDTAPYYGYGLAESDLGRFIESHRSDFTITTKVGLYPFGSPERHVIGVWARKVLGKLVPQLSRPVVNWQIQRASDSLTASLNRLRTDYVDFLLLHEPDAALLNTDEFMNWLTAERASGRIRAWGVAGEASNIKPWACSRHPLAAVIQTRDSLGKRQADFAHLINRIPQFTYGYFSATSENNQSTPTELMVREIFQRNVNGTVLVSTQRFDRLVSIARCAE